MQIVNIRSGDERISNSFNSCELCQSETKKEPEDFFQMLQDKR